MGYTNDETRCYSLRVFDEREEMFFDADSYSRRQYNSSSGRNPIMDLWDIAANGKRREILPAHVCGLAGFGASGDTCPRCDYDGEHRS